MRNRKIKTKVTALSIAYPLIISCGSVGPSKDEVNDLLERGGDSNGASGADSALPPLFTQQPIDPANWKNQPRHRRFRHWLLRF